MPVQVTLSRRDYAEMRLVYVEDNRARITAAVYQNYSFEWQREGWLYIKWDGCMDYHPDEVIPHWCSTHGLWEFSESMAYLAQAVARRQRERYGAEGDDWSDESFDVSPWEAARNALEWSLAPVVCVEEVE